MARGRKRKNIGLPEAQFEKTGEITKVRRLWVAKFKLSVNDKVTLKSHDLEQLQRQVFEFFKESNTEALANCFSINFEKSGEKISFRFSGHFKPNTV